MFFFKKSLKIEKFFVLEKENIYLINTILNFTKMFFLGKSKGENALQNAL